MERTVHITITRIVRVWGHPVLNGLTRAKQRRQLCKALLPDDFDHEKSTDAAALFLRESGDTLALSEGSLRMLVNGNRRSLSGAIDRLGSAAFTTELIAKLNRNEPIRYRAHQEPVCSRDDLLEKLHQLVRTSEPRLDRNSPFFGENPLEPDYPGGPGAESYARLSKLRRELLEQGSLRAVTWAAAITVLAAWTQWRVGELEWLYDRGAVEAYLSLPDGEPEKRGLEFHIPFDRESYMHPYHIHLYRPTARELYPIGTLTMERSGGQPVIRMELRYSLSDRPENLQGRWCYVGMPMLSPRDSMVYAVMADERSGAAAILSFHFTDFRSGDMYFRVGFLLTTHPLTHALQQQMVAITRREPDEAQRALIRGVLALGESLELSPEQLEGFLERHRDASWMPRFRERLLPFLRLHETKRYHLGTKELLEYSLSGLGYEDRLRIALLLKDCAAQTEDDGRLFLRAKEPEELHNLMK